jgi:hypothetical protein
MKRIPRHEIIERILKEWGTPTILGFRHKLPLAIIKALEAE